MSSTTADAAIKSGMTREEKFVIFASSLGTIFEWYDFYLYAVLAPFFAALFFPPGNDTAALLSAFATYAAGFLIRSVRRADLRPHRRPRRPQVHLPGHDHRDGRIDLPGRRAANLHRHRLARADPAGDAAAVPGPGARRRIRRRRDLRGRALRPGERGYATSWIQTTATLGLLLALIVIGLCRQYMDAKVFAEWGWRIPFLVSVILLVFSVYIRLRLNETPLFHKMKEEGKGSKAPLTESFFHYPNNKYVLLALLGATAGQGVVWYTGQFYALFFLTITLKLNYVLAYLMIGISLVLGTPFFILFGWLSDKIGRLKIILAGCLIAAVTYFPLFAGLTHYVNPDLEAFAQKEPDHGPGGPGDLQLPHLRGTLVELHSVRPRSGLPHEVGTFVQDRECAGNKSVDMTVGSTKVEGWDNARWSAALNAAGYKPVADPAKVNWAMATLILLIMVIYVTMVYGPIAAFLVEMFPTKIRYTSMSLPYHIGNGWFGGMLPLLATAIVAATGDIYAGLWYPIGIAVMTLIIGVVFLRDTLGVDLRTGSGVAIQKGVS